MKRKTEELIEEVSDFLFVYLKSGRISVNSFINDIHLNINNLDELLQVHFLLKDEVKQFVRNLPVHIRKFKTSTKTETETVHGNIRGQIAWRETITERLKRNYQNRTIYAINEQTKNYNLNENLVLKEFIGIIYIILHQVTPTFEKYNWFSEWLDLKKTVDHVYLKNIYLSRVKTNKGKITERMLANTVRHRNPLYNQAARLFIEYRKVMSRNLNKQDIQELIKQTFVTPEKEEVLFELYWVIKLITSNSSNAQLQIIDGKQNLVASWLNNGFLYKIYHDSTGSNLLRFQVTTDELQGTIVPYLNKRLDSIEKADSISKAVFGRSIDTKNFWSGRPDILVEIYDSNTKNLVKVIIGEVKHTTNISYAIEGLRELLDYMLLIKDKNGVYMSNQEVAFEGMLFVDNLLIQKSKLENVRIINHANYGELILQL